MILNLRANLLLICLMLVCSVGAVADDGLVVEDDLFLGVWSPYASSWKKEVPICIWSEDRDQFRIVATGLSSGQQFSLSNELGDLVRYRVTVRSGRRFRARERLRQNVPSRGVYRSSATEFCADGETARVRVIINKRQIDRALPAVYTDTLLLVLSPQ